MASELLRPCLGPAFARGKNQLFCSVHMSCGVSREGGFFLERWGDAPVHSLGAALFLNASQVSNSHLLMTCKEPQQIRCMCCHPVYCCMVAVLQICNAGLLLCKDIFLSHRDAGMQLHVCRCISSRTLATATTACCTAQPSTGTSVPAMHSTRYSSACQLLAVAIIPGRSSLQPLSQLEGLCMADCCSTA